MTVRAPTRDELIAAGHMDSLEQAVAKAKLEDVKTRTRDPLVTPDTPVKAFNFQDMLATPIPAEPDKPEALIDKIGRGLHARPRGKAAVRGGKRLAKALDKPVSEGSKVLQRIALETAGEIAALSRFGPPGTVIGATTGFIKALPPVGRALAVSFPRTARAVQSAPIAALGTGVGSLIAEIGDPRPGSPIGRAVTAGAFGATGEAFVPGFARAGEALRRGGYALNKGAREVVENLVGKGQAVSPGFFSDNFAIQVMDNVASGSMFGGGRMRRAQLGGTQVMQEAAEDFIKTFRTFASDSTEVQTMTQELLAGRADAWRLVAKKKFGVIDDITDAGARVNVSALNAPISKARRLAGGEEATSEIAKEIARLEEVGSISRDGTMTFEAAADLRSWLLRIGRRSTEVVPGQAKTLGGNLAKSLDRQMEESFKGLLPDSGLPIAELKRAWREANAFWKTGIEDFNSTLVKTITKAEPRQVALAIRRNTANIRRVKRLLTEGAPGVKGADDVLTESGLTGKQVWNEIQGEILNDMAIKSMGEVADTPVFMGNKMLRALRTNEEQMTELLGKDGYDNAMKIFRQVQLAQGGAVEKNLPGKVFITFKQAGAVSEVGGMVMGVGSGASPEAFALLAGPATMGRLITSKPFTKWALLGLDPKTPTAKATRAITQMMAMALKEGATVEEVEPSPDEAVKSRRPIPPFLPATFAGPGG